ncbi:MAG: phosphate ABC transporter permease PstA [Alphaproteobacteria bacterium]|nr:phosphate ABC transporter permease PstA [Alphaproteobacteria bacterium]
MSAATAIFDRSGRRRVYNGVFVLLCMLATAIALVALAAILFSLLRNGFGGFGLSVFTEDTPPPGASGGLRNAILGSVLLCFAAMIAAVILGMLAGTWLAEYSRDGWYSRTVRFVNDVLLSAPSILVGLFVYVIAVRPLHGFSALAGALALALIAAPIVTRATEDVLRLQPRTLRESGVGLGTPFWIIIWRILWKAAAGGIITGALLAFARISGETAPLLFTALNNQFFSVNLLRPIANLPVTIFNFALSPYEDWQKLAWAGALLIAFAVLAINVLVRILAMRGKHV